MIVLGISASFFSNYFLLNVGEHNWRWMLGMDAVPAVLYFFLLFAVPESPHWLFGQGRPERAREILTRACGVDQAEEELRNIRQSFAEKTPTICASVPRAEASTEISGNQGSRGRSPSLGWVLRQSRDSPPYLR
jgi:MFS family permease